MLLFYMVLILIIIIYIRRFFGCFFIYYSPQIKTPTVFISTQLNTE